MRTYLVRVGIDQAVGKWNAAIDPGTGDFVYIPIPEKAESAPPLHGADSHTDKAMIGAAGTGKRAPVEGHFRPKAPRRFEVTTLSPGLAPKDEVPDCCSG